MARKNGKDRGLIEKGPGKWAIRYYVDGKDVVRLIGNKTAARAEYERIKTNQRLGEPVVGPLKTKIKDLINLGLADAKAQGHKSLKEITRFAALLEKHWEGKKAAHLTTSDTVEYRTLRKAGDLTTKDFVKRPKQKHITKVTDSTINRELSWLRHCYHLGFKHEPPLVSRIPNITILEEHNTRTGFFEYEEFVNLREHLPAHVKPIVTVGFYTGLRLGEILGLQWTQIDFAQGTLRLEAQTTKNGEAREVPLATEVRSILEAWRLTTMEKWPACPWVAHFDGEHIKRINTAWKTACKKAGLKGKLFHDLRRTAIRNLVRAGVNQAIAKKISGHKTDSVFQRYNIVDKKDLVDAAKRIDLYHSQTVQNSKNGNGTGTKPGLSAIEAKS